MNTDNKSYYYLIVAPAWVGDMVMAQSLFKTLKLHKPDCKIDVLAPAWSIALTQRMPEVSRVFTQTIPHGKLGLKIRYQQAQQLKKNHYNQAIVLPNSFKSALVVWWANIPKRTGYVGEWRYPLLNDIRVLDKQYLSRTVDRFIALSLAKDAKKIAVQKPVLTSNMDALLATVEKFNLPTKKPILALCPGAEYGEAKRWPEQHYGALAKLYINKGWTVCLLGSDKDKMIGNTIQKIAPSSYQLCGQTDLSEVIDILALSTKVVSNDSGLMHIAAALDKPLIAIYGSSDPNFTPPLSEKSLVMSLNLDCSPCFKRVCPKKKGGYPPCLVDINSTQIAEKLENIGKINLNTEIS